MLSIPLHRERACREVIGLQSVLPLDPNAIPQLEEWKARLIATSGFRMLPAASLVRAQTFMRCLGSRIFLSTR